MCERPQPLLPLIREKTYCTLRIDVEYALLDFERKCAKKRLPLASAFCIIR